MAHKHPGVTLMKEQPAREWVDPQTGRRRQSGAIYFRARYRDPATGRYRYETLPREFVHKEPGLRHTPEACAGAVGKVEGG